MFYGVNILFTWILILTTTIVGDYPSNNKRALDLPDQIKFEVIDGLMILKIPNADGIKNFIFDTGTEQIIFNDVTENTTSEIVSVDGTYDINDIIVDKFIIGTKELQEVPAWGLNLAFLSNQLEIEVEGVLGAQLFGDYSLLIDYDEQVIKLIDHLSNPSITNDHYDVVSVDFTQDNMDLPIIDISIDGELLKFGFDTGANICVIEQNAKALASSIPSNKHELSSLKISNAKITKVPFLLKDFTELNRSRKSKIDGLISAAALGTNKIFIDSSRGKIYLFWAKSSPLASE